MENGLYLVRKSRQRMNSYTLHVCLNSRVRNFEVKMNNEGKLYILPNATFESLLKLVYYYHKDKVCVYDSVRVSMVTLELLFLWDQINTVTISVVLVPLLVVNSVLIGVCMYTFLYYNYCTVHDII